MWKYTDTLESGTGVAAGAAVGATATFSSGLEGARKSSDFGEVGARPEISKQRVSERSKRVS